MSQFELFQRMKKACQEKNISSNNNEVKEVGEVGECSHHQSVVEKGINICVDCGEETYCQEDSKNCRYFGGIDTNHVSDINRVRIRKSDQKSIFKDVENLNFSDKIKEKANEIYTKVTKGRIYRGKSRKALIFGAFYHAFKLSETPQSHEKLIKIFGFSRQICLNGLKTVSHMSAKDSDIRRKKITTLDLLNETMDKFKASDAQKEEVCRLYKSIKNKSSKLNRSRPQSVSASVIFYWIRSTDRNISIDEFTKQVSLSEATILKNMKEISKILNE